MPFPSNQGAIDLFVRRLCWHSQLTDDERAAIRALPTFQQEVRAHRDIIRADEIVSHACLVSEGLVGRYGEAEDGKRQFVSIHIPGEMVDLPSVMVPRSSTALHALSSSTILRVPHDALRKLGFQYPAIAAAFWRDCMLDLNIVAQWLVNGRRDARSRMAHLLCELATRYRSMDQSDGQSFELPMTQEQLGDTLNLTSVHTNRTMMALRNEGLVKIARSKVEIEDWDGLVNAAEFHPAYLSVATGSA